MKPNVLDVPIGGLLLHQRSAPIDARERLLEIVATWRALPDRAVLATCHRVEIYVSDRSRGRIAALADELDGQGELGGALAVVHGREAVAHLFEVTAGLDSAVQGEPQIRGQVRAVLASAPRDLDPSLRRLFERALRFGRAARRSGGRCIKSVGSFAVAEVVALLPEPERATVLVVGAGEMGALAVRSLSRRVAHVVVANRDRARADALARSVGAEAIDLAAIAPRIETVDAIVSAADTRGTALTASVLAPRLRHGRLALVDIAVPRSVSSDARGLDGLVYRSVDDLRGAIALPADEAARVRAACAAEADRFAREARERAAGAAIGRMRAKADDVRMRQLDRALRQLGHLSARDRRVVAALSARVVNTLLHEPTLALKRAPDRSDDALALFGLDGKHR